MWTKELPTQSGHYWWRKNQYKSEHIVCIWADHEESIEKENLHRATIDAEPLSRYDSINKVAQENKVFYARYSSASLSDKVKLESIKGEWHGPLKPPE